MRTVILAILTLAAMSNCQRKKAAEAPANDPHQLTIDSIAAYALLEEIESEDPYLAAGLTESEIEEEMKKRADRLRQQVDANKNGLIEPGESETLKRLVKDKMLEQFDIDSNGGFNQVERHAILEKILRRIDDAKNQSNSSKS